MNIKRLSMVLTILLCLIVLAACESPPPQIAPVSTHYVTPSDLIGLPSYKYQVPNTREPVRTVGVEIQHTAYNWDMHLEYASFEQVGGPAFSVYVAEGYELTSSGDIFYIREKEGGREEDYIEISFWAGGNTNFLDIAPLIIESNEDIYTAYESYPHFLENDPRFPVRSIRGTTFQEGVYFSCYIMSVQDGYICIYSVHYDDINALPSVDVVQSFMAETFTPEK